MLSRKRLDDKNKKLDLRQRGSQIQIFEKCLSTSSSQHNVVEYIFTFLTA
jgi:hypothetical protein